MLIVFDQHKAESFDVKLFSLKVILFDVLFFTNIG